MKRSSTLGLLGCVALTLASCGRAPQRPNVLFIIVDTLRADHLSCAGYERETSPNIDSFAAESLRFTHAQTPRAKTTPAVASIFTGLYPHGHGVRDLVTPLPIDVPVLAERYAAAKFVLTVRNATAWVGSALRWIDHKRPENPNYGARFWEALGRRDATPPTHREAEALIRSHDADVRNYFASRNESARLLEVDFSAEVDASAFWTRLCAFVGLAGTICPCPPVPRANANGAAARDEFGQPLARRRRRP